MSPREERAIRNETLFREVNVHIAELEERIQASGEPLSLICECAKTGCALPIEVDPAVFQAVRESPRRYLVAPGHQRIELETLIEQHNGYVIVEKHTL